MRKCVLPDGNCEAVLEWNVAVTVAAGDVKCAVAFIAGVNEVEEPGADVGKIELIMWVAATRADVIIPLVNLADVVISLVKATEVVLSWANVDVVTIPPFNVAYIQ